MTLKAGHFWIAVWLVLVGGCTVRPSLDLSSLKPASPVELQEHVASREPTFEVFASAGPFAVTQYDNRELRLSDKERVSTDLFRAATDEQAPLLIFLHGHESSKRAHWKQAAHAASWGMHALTVQLPNKGPWDSNGRTLARIINFIVRSPAVIDSGIDAKKIILVGYSFGASGVAVALAQGAPAAGAILLDPAAIGKDLPNLLLRIDKPVIILGADDQSSSTRHREYFFDFVRSNIAELSIRGAAHEDAQYPSDFALANAGKDPNTTQELQMLFVSALTSAAISLSATGSFDLAWRSFARAFESGTFFNAKKK